MFESVETWLLGLDHALLCWAIFLLMAVESSCFPFPSEVVMIPAGYLAYLGRINLSWAVALGILGSIAGAVFNYALALWLGRPLLRRYGRWLFLPEERLLKVEAFFRRHGEVSTFVGRLIPVIRQYISLPAGLARMNFLRFVVFTAAGAGLWVSVLACAGFFGGATRKLWLPYLKHLSWALGAAALLLFFLYLWRARNRQAAGAAPGQADGQPPA